MVRITVYFPEETYKKTKKYCEENKCSVNEILTDLIKKYIENGYNISGKGYTDYDYSVHQFPLRISKELNKKFELKMIERKDNNKSKIIINLTEHFLKKQKNNNEL